MKTQSTYEGWDFEAIWEISPTKNNGYPILLWQNSGHIASAIASSSIPNQTWTGSPITPNPSINFKGNNLIERTDFEYAYDNNIQTGTAILRIIGKGSYSGQQAKVEFKIIPASCGTGFAGGTGTETDPYKIAEARNLDAISNCLGNSYEDKYYELQNDIDLGSYLANASAGWQPIGSSNNSFYGKFNGSGHRVSGLWINRPFTNNIGLFGSVWRGALRDIGVEIDNGKGGVTGNSYVGGLAGRNDGTISNSYATGSVLGNNVGGLVGRNDGTIVSSYATGSVTGNYVGGLAGYNYSGTISNSYATGSVLGNYVGGLVWYNYGSGTISNSYYDKETTGRTDTGKGTGKTTAEMKTQSTYEGWDFENTWVILSTVVNKGYPILQWQAQGKTILEGVTMSSIPSSQPYIGSAIKPTFTVTFNGATLTKDTDYSISYYNNRNAGTAKITVSGIGKYLGSIEADFTITAKPITVTGITAINREYNGTTTIELTGGVFNGVLGGDDVFAGTGTVATSDIGNSKTVTNITLAGTDAGNYTFTQPTGITVNITPKPVTITGISAKNKIYDGTTTATLNESATINGKIASDNVNINSTAFFADKNIGTNKTVTFSGFSLSGTAASNYTLESQPISVTANITPKPITITGVTATNRIYDDGKTVIILNGGTLVGVENGDAVGFILGTGTSGTSINKPVATNITLTGTDAPNYTLTQPTDITVPITTPISTNRENPIIGRIGVQTKGNTILLSNLPSNAKVEVYNLQGKLIFSSGKSVNRVNRGSDNLQIQVQTKGMYIIKVSNQTLRIAVK